MEEDHVWEDLKSLTTYKSKGTDKMLLGEVPEEQESVNVNLSFKTGKKEYLGNYRQMKQIILEILSKRIKDKKLIGSSHHRFLKAKLCLTT